MDPDALRAEKADLRFLVRAQAAALSNTMRQQSDALLFARLLALPHLAQAQTVFLFLGQGIEPHTQVLCEQLLAQGKRLCLPRCLPGRQMEARRVHALDDLVPSAFGIPEPTARAPLVPKTELDLILAPALCCDRAGYRLGQGGGYYDRYLADYEGVIITLCRHVLLQEHLPRGDFDRAVDWVLTEEVCLSTKRQEQSGEASPPPCRI